MSKVISIDELKNKATEIIEIPDFDGDGTINIRVKKPQIMSLITSGKIPNPLLPTALSILDGRDHVSRKNKTEDQIAQDIAIEGAKSIEIYCRACMVEPSFEEAGEYLTDEQMLAIFNWAIGGVKKMANFRSEQEDDPDTNDVKDVPKDTKRNTKDK